MTKLEFMKELESLLLDIPLEEREEALQYYNDYFEDAGEDHEEEIIKELGSPKKVAKIIKADLSTNAADRETKGYFTEKGYQETVNNEYEIVSTAKKDADNGSQAGSVNNSANTENAGNSQGMGSQFNQGAYNNQYSNQGQSQNTQQGSKSNNSGLVLLLVICTFPFWLPFVMAAFGIIIGLIAAIFGIVFGFGVAGITMIGTGIALFVYGLVQISVPFIGAALVGSGLIVLGLGMMFILASVLLCKKVLPAMIKGIAELCRMPFKNRRVMA